MAPLDLNIVYRKEEKVASPQMEQTCSVNVTILFSKILQNIRAVKRWSTSGQNAPPPALLWDGFQQQTLWPLPRRLCDAWHLSLCLSVNKNNRKSYEQILMSFSGSVDNEPGNWFNLGDVLDSGGTLTFNLPEIKALIIKQPITLACITTICTIYSIWIQDIFWWILYHCLAEVSTLWAFSMFEWYNKHNNRV